MGAGRRHSRARSRSDTTGSDARLGAAGAIFLNGLIHLQLALAGPGDDSGRLLAGLLLLHVVVSIAVAAALVRRSDAPTRMVAAGLLAVTLLAFAASRSRVALFDGVEPGLAPSPQALLVLTCCLGGLILLSLTFVASVGAGRPLTPTAARALTIGGVVASVLAGFVWAGGARDTSTALTITDRPPDATVPPATAEPSVTTMPPATIESPETTQSPPETTEPPPQTTEPPPETTEPAPESTEAVTTEPPPETTEPPGTTDPPRPPEVVSLRIGDFGFDPEVLEIRVGDTVRWVHDGTFDHSVVAVDDSFSSVLLLNRGDTYSHRFENPGWYPYGCELHPSLDGVIVVNA